MKTVDKYIMTITALVGTLALTSNVFGADTPYKLTSCECTATVDGNSVAIELAAEKIEDDTLRYLYEHTVTGENTDLGLTCTWKGASIPEDPDRTDGMEASVGSAQIFFKDKRSYFYSFDGYSKEAKFKASNLKIQSSQGTITGIQGSCTMTKG
jgi:hypothetical protein